VLVAIRQNEDRTMFLGYDVHRCMRMAFLISGIFGGLGGSLLIAYQSFVSPAVYYWGLSGEILVMDLLGGMGTLIGPIIGSAFIISVGDVISSWVAKTWLMILGSLYVICIIFFPEGMMGIVTRFGRIGQRHAVTGNKEPQ
jgi:branched-chain amino acid transport system permease protein